MLTIRLAKILMIAAVGAFALMVTYDNIVDYGSNYEFVRHVLSMDTTFSGNALMDRAVTGARVWKSAYAAIITAEGLICVLLCVGALTLLMRLRAPAAAFNRASFGRSPASPSASASGSSAFWSSPANTGRCGSRGPGMGRRRRSASPW
jgi:predicted small integral membrane protein